MVQKHFNKLFKEYTGEEITSFTELPSSGSNRRYFRLESMHYSVIGVKGTSKEENEAFIYIAERFRKKGIPVPEVYGNSEDYIYYIQEDLGDSLLFNSLSNGIKTGVFNKKEQNLLYKTIAYLPKIQFEGAEGFDFSKCYPTSEFNRRSILWDLNYFKYCFLKPSGLDFQENQLEDDFEKLADILLKEEFSTFMYRDFQSRNVIIKEEQPYFIDFQGGRKGPIYYDVASFLWQAKAAYSGELRENLLETYLKELEKYQVVDKTYFLSQLRHFVLFRILQVLGVYGFRGYFEQKSYFIESVPFALKNLKEWLVQSETEYPYLYEVLNNLVNLEQFSSKSSKSELEVNIYSFAYKNGIPKDTSGNGGGFVFDCRAIHNPGRYEEYKPLTGLDESVIKFLEDDGEITTFLENIYSIVDKSVERYLERGFTNLIISFGCTGGRHRSVYSAQKLAEHIYHKFNVKVNLYHREQNITKQFTPQI